MIYNENLNAILLDAIPMNFYKKLCGSGTLYIVLFAVFLVTSTVISTVSRQNPTLLDIPKNYHLKVLMRLFITLNISP